MNYDELGFAETHVWPGWSCWSIGMPKSNHPKSLAAPLENGPLHMDWKSSQWRRPTAIKKKGRGLGYWDETTSQINGEQHIWHEKWFVTCKNARPFAFFVEHVWQLLTCPLWHLAAPVPGVRWSHNNPRNSSTVECSSVPWEKSYLWDSLGWYSGTLSFISKTKCKFNYFTSSDPHHGIKSKSWRVLDTIISWKCQQLNTNS